MCNYRIRKFSFLLVGGIWKAGSGTLHAKTLLAVTNHARSSPKRWRCSSDFFWSW